MYGKITMIGMEEWTENNKVLRKWRKIIRSPLRRKLMNIWRLIKAHLELCQLLSLSLITIENHPILMILSTNRFPFIKRQGTNYLWMIMSLLQVKNLFPIDNRYLNLFSGTILIEPYSGRKAIYLKFWETGCPLT